MHSLYFDCFSGAAGDMLVGALLDLGGSIDQLREDLGRLRLSGYRISAERSHQGALAGTRFHVVVVGEQPRRSFPAIREVIEPSTLPREVKDRSLEIFRRIGVAEAKVHDCPFEEVHFHEVGAVDSIVDIVGFCSLYQRLGAPTVYCSPLVVGGGFVRTEHGMIPVPAMATLELLKGIPVEPCALREELLTPTGAAILGAVTTRFGRDFSYVPAVIGYGLGSRTRVDPPNAVRAVLCEIPSTTGETIVVLETNLDDVTGQDLARVIEVCLSAGALDALVLPAVMKKGRPGHLLQVLAAQERTAALEAVLFRETSTLGVRSHLATRHVLQREAVQVDTSLGSAWAKRIRSIDGKWRAVIERDEVERLSAATGRSAFELQRTLQAEIDQSERGERSDRPV